ncbi:MAG: prepilin-type N-terminal cleavage/methylation domain-containing protein [Tepidisphaeraceae bacterium]
MRRTKAFTLVELLVVIGIIALLISILLPSLNRAREQAKMVQCLSNLRQFAIGLRLYADANRGMLVEPQLKAVTVSGVSVIGSQAYPQTGTTTINTGTTYDPAKTVLYHIGRLWQQKYLTNGRAGYCPSNYDAPFFGWNAVGDKWPAATGTGATSVRSDYMYQPVWRYMTDPNLNRIHYRRFADVPANRMLAADIARSQAYTSHKNRGVNPAWNVVFPDGHAVTVVSKELWATMKTESEYTNSASDWAILEDFRDILETQAAGRNLSDNPYNGVKGQRVLHIKGEATWGMGTLDGRPAGKTN